MASFPQTSMMQLPILAQCAIAVFVGAVAAMVFATPALAGTAFAASPAARGGVGLPRPVASQPRPSVSAGSSSAAPHLDLRLLDANGAADYQAASERRAAVFPAYLHRQGLGGPLEQNAAGQETSSLPSGGRLRSPLEEFTRRVHREGLPVARLWENKSALVSLGLNQKGKPGLWLVQKIH